MSVPSRARTVWRDYTDTSTPVRSADIEIWEAGVYELRSRILSVKDACYGALGDGSTDDTAAIHAARTAAGSGGAIYFPAGTYAVNGLTANTTNQTWVLERGATLKAAAGASAPVVVVTAAGVQIIGRGVIDGNRPNVTSGVAGVYSAAPAASDLIVDGVTIQHVAGYGIQAAGSRTRVRRCTFSDIAADAVIIQPTSASISDCEITDNYIDKTGESAGTSYGAVKINGLTSGGYTNVRGRVTGNSILMPSNPTDSTGLPICIEFNMAAHYGVVANNRSSGGSMGVSVGTSDGCTVSNNTIYGPNWYGIEVAGSVGTTVSGNTIDGNGLTGGGVSGTAALGAITTDGTTPSNRTTIANNVVRNIASGNGASGIALTSGTGSVVSGNMLDVVVHGILASVSTVTIVGNRLFGTSLTNSRGIGLLNVSGRASICGNSCQGFDRGVAFEASTATIAHVAVVGNQLSLSVTTPIFKSITGSGAVGTNIVLRGNTGAADVLDLANNVLDSSGAGTPEGAVTAGIGSTYRRNDGAAGTSFYVKESGSGNTGWVGK